MTRSGPGFLIDLLFLWLVVMACVVVAQTIERQLGRPLGLALGIVASIFIVFLFLLAYYRVYLDERPFLGSASRTQFGILVFQVVLIGFVIGAMVAQPDPATQAGVAGAVILVGIIVSYWWVYRRNDPGSEEMAL